MPKGGKYVEMPSELALAPKPVAMLPAGLQRSPLHVDILLLGGIAATRKWAAINIESVA